MVGTFAYEEGMKSDIREFVFKVKPAEQQKKDVAAPQQPLLAAN